MRIKLMKILMSIILLSMSSLSMFSNISKALSPASDEIYEGIDVSTFQGYIDYEKVKQAGIQVVYIKASEGETLEDELSKTQVLDI